MCRSSSEELDPQPILGLDGVPSLEHENVPLEPSLAAFELKKTLQAYEEILKELKQKLIDKEGDLKDARDLIFRLQPSHQHITQNEAQKNYNALCESVASWINYHLEATFDDDSTVRQDFNIELGEFLCHQMTPSSTFSRGILESDEWHVIGAVMNFLLQEILGKDFYGAAQEGAIEFLDILLRSMNCLEPRRETSTCRAWRSEALVALANSPDFASRRAIRSHELAQKLKDMLVVLLPGATQQELDRKEESLRNSIVKPAIELAERIHMSPEQFRFYFSEFAYSLKRNEKGNPPRFMEDLANLDCVNLLQAGKAVRSSVLQDPSLTSHVIYLFDLFPGLSCQTFNGDVPSEVKILKRPRVLVAVIRSGKEDSDRIQEASTLMSFIYDQVQPNDIG